MVEPGEGSGVRERERGLEEEAEEGDESGSCREEGDTQEG